MRETLASLKLNLIKKLSEITLRIEQYTFMAFVFYERHFGIKNRY